MNQRVCTRINLKIISRMGWQTPPSWNWSDPPGATVAICRFGSLCHKRRRRLRPAASGATADTTTMQKKVKPHERPGSTDEALRITWGQAIAVSPKWVQDLQEPPAPERQPMAPPTDGVGFLPRAVTLLVGSRNGVVVVFAHFQGYTGDE